MNVTSSFQKAMWCGAAVTTVLFVTFAATLQPGGNYAGMLGRLTGMCFMPAIVAGWIAGRGSQPKGWLTVAGLFSLLFIAFSILAALGRQR